MDGLGWIDRFPALLETSKSVLVKLTRLDGWKSLCGVIYRASLCDATKCAFLYSVFFDMCILLYISYSSQNLLDCHPALWDLRDASLSRFQGHRISLIRHKNQTYKYESN